MTYREKFISIAENPEFKFLARCLKQQWDLNQKKFKTVADVINDDVEILLRNKDTFTKEDREFLDKRWNYYIKIGSKLKKITLKDVEEFRDDLVVTVQTFNLPEYCHEMLFDYITTGKVKEDYQKIRMVSKQDWQSDTGSIVLHVSPDARLKDIKQIWHEVVRRQSFLHKGDLRTQKLRNPVLTEKILKPLAQGKKIDQFEIRDKLFGMDQYQLDGPEFKKIGQRVNALIRNTKSRYKKKISPYLKLSSTKNR
jgi:hypothetical protein